MTKVYYVLDPIILAARWFCYLMLRALTAFPSMFIEANNVLAAPEVCNKIAFAQQRRGYFFLDAGSR